MTRPARTWATLVAAAVFLTAGCGRDDDTRAAKTDDVPDRAEKVRPLLVGAQVPALVVRDAAGERFDLSRALEAKPTVLVFYRGGWCHYCKLQMAQLTKLHPKLTALGYQLIGISPDTPANASASAAKAGLKYTLLSDSEATAARAFGVAFRADAKLLGEYKEDYGVDVEAASGADHHILPAPSVFVIDRAGRIRFQHVSPDFRDRIDSELLLSAAKSALAKRRRL